VLLYDLHAEPTVPPQYRVLGFEVGGVSELQWISQDLLVVGTSRGRLVVFSLRNEAVNLVLVIHVIDMILTPTSEKAVRNLQRGCSWRRRCSSCSSKHRLLPSKPYLGFSWSRRWQRPSLASS